MPSSIVIVIFLTCESLDLKYGKLSACAHTHTHTHQMNSKAALQ